MKYLSSIIFFICSIVCAANNSVITNGVPWFDTDGNVINAHGVCIVEDGGKYWLFGEYKSDESNAFPPPSLLPLSCEYNLKGII